MASKVWLFPVLRPNPKYPFECECAEPGYFISVGRYIKGKHRVEHYTCSNCLHIGVWDDTFDGVVCDKLLISEKLLVPYIFDCRCEDRAAYERAMSMRAEQSERAMLAGMEGGCDAYNEAMGWEVGDGE